MDAKNLSNEIIENINNQIEAKFIEALKIKGFEFQNRNELEDFISKNCTCIDSIHLNEKTYYVKGIPFFLHCYKTKINPIIESKIGVSISADYGRYAYL